MRMLVYGAGAIGSYLGAILTSAGHDVTLLTRGAQHEALSTRGLVLKGKLSGRPEPIRVHAIRPGEEKPPYDIVFVTLKAHQIAPSAEPMTQPTTNLPWFEPLCVTLYFSFDA